MLPQVALNCNLIGAVQPAGISLSPDKSGFRYGQPIVEIHISTEYPAHSATAYGGLSQDCGTMF